MDNLDIKNLRRMIRESLVREVDSALSGHSDSIAASSIGNRETIKNNADEITNKERGIINDIFKVLNSAAAIEGVDLNTKKSFIIRILNVLMKNLNLSKEEINSIYGSINNDTQQVQQNPSSTAETGEPQPQNENMHFSTGEKIRDDGHEVSMAESELYKIAEYAPEIYGMIENYEDLPGWVQKKITIASENISSVKHYLEHEHFRNKSGLDKQ